MHICFVTSEFPKKGFPHGGIGTFVATLGKALVVKGIKVSVVGLNYVSGNETEIINGVTVYRINPKKRKGLQWYYNSKAISNKIDAIHNQYPIDIVETPELGLAFLPKREGVKYIIRLHGGHHFFAEAENRRINWWKGFQEKRSFFKADAFIAVSSYVKTHTEKYLSYRNKPVAYINNPVNTDVFKPIEKESSKHSIVFAGTVCEKKGVRQLIQAFAFVKDEFPDTLLNIYGRDWLFPDGSSYIMMLREKELHLLGKAAESVFFNGAVTQDVIAEKYAEADVCVFPSHMETQGLVAPEAMAMEKPVVFTIFGPGPETIIEYETGLLCNPKDPKEIAEKIKWVFKHPEESKAMGQNGRVDVERRFGVEVIMKQNLEFYDEILIAKI